MKKLILLPVLFLGIMFAHGQENWPPIGATWHYTYEDSDIWDPGSGIEFITFEVEKDTTIDDMLCKKIIVEYHRFDGSIKYLGDEYIYSTEDKVYNYHHNKFYTLYDFTVNVGDTLNLFLGSNCKLYSQLDSDYDNDSIWVKHFVNKRDSIEINGKKHLVIGLNNPVPDPFYLWYNAFYGEIVKGVGSLVFLTGNIYAPFEAPYYGPLRCYSGGILNYTTNIPCDTLISSVLVESVNEKSNVYPNPVGNEFSLNFYNPDAKAVKIKIYDTAGNLIKTIATLDNSVVLSSDGFDKGVYFYLIYSKAEILGSGKFVK